MIFDMQEVLWKNIQDSSDLFGHTVHRMKMGRQYQFPLHVHRNFHEVVILQEGEVSHSVAKQKIKQRESTLLYIPADSSHNLTSNGGTLLNIILPMDWLEHSGIELPQDLRLFSLESEELSYVTSLYDRYAVNTDSNSSHILYFRLILLLSEWIINHSQEASTAMHEVPSWYLRARTKLASGEWHPNSVAQLAELCNISPAHMSRSWKELTGESPIHFLQTLRLEKAARLLGMSNETIEVISEIAGYDSTGYFYRVFKDQFGMSPHQYRKKMKRFT